MIQFLFSFLSKFYSPALFNPALGHFVFRFFSAKEAGEKKSLLSPPPHLLLGGADITSSPTSLLFKKNPPLASDVCSAQFSHWQRSPSPFSIQGHSPAGAASPGFCIPRIPSLLSLLRPPALTAFSSKNCSLPPGTQG